MPVRRNVALRLWDFIRSIPSRIFTRNVIAQASALDTKESFIDPSKANSKNKDTDIPDKNDELAKLKQSMIDEYMRESDEMQGKEGFYITKDGYLLEIKSEIKEFEKEGRTVNKIDFSTRCLDPEGKKVIAPKDTPFKKISKEEFIAMESERPYSERALAQKRDFLYQNLVFNPMIKNIVIDNKLNIASKDGLVEYSHKIINQSGEVFMVKGREPEQLKNALEELLRYNGKKLSLDVQLDKELILKEIQSKLKSKSNDHLECLGVRINKDGTLKDSLGFKVSEKDFMQKIKEAVISGQDIKFEEFKTKEHLQKEKVTQYFKDLYKEKEPKETSKSIEKQKFHILSQDIPVEEKVTKLANLAAINNVNLEVMYDNRIDRNQPGDMGSIFIEPHLKGKRIEVEISTTNDEGLKSYINFSNMRDSKLNDSVVTELIADQNIYYGIDSAAKSTKMEVEYTKEKEVFSDLQEKIETILSDGITVNALASVRDVVFESGKDISFVVEDKEIAFKFENNTMKINAGVKDSFVDAYSQANLGKMVAAFDRDMLEIERPDHDFIPENKENDFDFEIEDSLEI